MKKTIRVKSSVSIVNGKRVSRKAHIRRIELKEPRIVNGQCKSVQHILDAQYKLMSIRQFSERDYESYQVIMRQYPEVASLIQKNRPLSRKTMDDSLRRA